MGVIGSRTGFSSYLLVRLAFGDVGARLVNLAFSVSLLGWFGINLNLFGLAAEGLVIEIFDSVPSSFGVMIAASFMITMTTLVGFRAINLVSTLLIPVLIGIAISLFIAASASSITTTAGFGTTMSLGQGISSIVGSIIIGAIIMPDITRFVRHSSGAWVTAGASYLVAQPCAMWVAGVASYYLGDTDIISIMLTLGLGLGAFAIVIAGSWVLNALNLYSAVLGITASFPAISARVITILFGLVGVTTGLLNVLDSFVVFLFYLSVIFIPVAGVIIVDYWWVRPLVYSCKEVAPCQPLNIAGLAAWFLGAAAALAGSEALIPSITSVAALDAITVAALSYLLFSILTNGDQ